MCIRDSGGTDGVAVAGGKCRQLVQLGLLLRAGAAETLFFDDDAANVAAASAAGFRCSVHCPQGFAAPSFRAAIDVLDGRTTAAALRQAQAQPSRAPSSVSMAAGAPAG